MYSLHGLAQPLETQGVPPQQGTEPNAWCGQQELQVLTKFDCNIILWLSITVGLLRALKIFTKQLQNFNSHNDWDQKRFLKVPCPTPYLGRVT